MQRLLAIASKFLFTGFHPSIEKHRELESAIEEICPRLNTRKLLLLSMMTAFEPSLRCKERTWMIVEQAVKTTRQISNWVETVEESLQLLQNITLLEEVLITVQIFIQTKSRSTFLFLKKDDLAAQSSVLAAQLTAILETFKVFSPFYGIMPMVLSAMMRQSPEKCFKSSPLRGQRVRQRSHFDIGVDKTSGPVHQSSLEHQASSIIETDLNEDKKLSQSGSHFSGARNPYITGGTYFNVFGNYVSHPLALLEKKDLEQVHSPTSTAEDGVIVLDSSTKGCIGFPTGIFRIRAAGSDHYWTPHWFEAHQEGNSFCIWPLDKTHLSQVFFINPKGNLCCGFGTELDVMGNAIIITHDRQPTDPWPNPWSHPLPTFSYSKESKLITVKFYADPLVSDHWPRPESEWKDREFVLAAQSMVATQVRSFHEIARWAPDSGKSTRHLQWTTRVGHRSEAHEWCNLGVEEKRKIMGPQDLNRIKWEIETP